MTSMSCKIMKHILCTEIMGHVTKIIIYSSENNTIPAHMWAERGKGFRSHAPYGRIKTRSSRKYATQASEKEGASRNTHFLAGERENFEEGRTLRAVKMNVWPRKRSFTATQMPNGPSREPIFLYRLYSNSWPLPARSANRCKRQMSQTTNHVNS